MYRESWRVDEGGAVLQSGEEERRGETAELETTAEVDFRCLPSTLPPFSPSPSSLDKRYQSRPGRQKAKGERERTTPDDRRLRD